MIKFEEHDGKLFRMLEEPTPLTPDAEMPCLVRLIQDDSPMGRHNKFAFSPLMKNNNPIIIDSIKENAVSIAFNHMVLHYYNFEILGYPVAEGSAEWAWYQMMQGEKIRYAGMILQGFYAIKKGCDYCAFYDNEWKEVDINTRRTYREFIEYAKAFPGYGWRILKEHEYPKPESQYKVGDWVELNNNYQGQIKKVFPAGMDELRGTRIHRTEPTFLITGLFREYHYDTITRKLSPSEVVIRIGCLSGTVEPVSINGIHIWFHLIGVDDKTIATIRISSLDAQTRELVESLLKAQEEKRDRT